MRYNPFERGADGKLLHRRVDGLAKAYSLVPDRLSKALAEFRSLNTREARAAFADHWIGVWAKDFELAWPMAYELLHIIEEDKLYKDPRRVGPGAPGERDTHGDRPSYDSFADYFADRVRRPFEHWAELEKTYKYASTYAPELFELPYEAAALGAHGGQPGNRNAAKDKPENEGDNVTSVSDRGNSATYTIRRLKRDRPDLADRVVAGEMSANAAAIEAGFRRKPTPLDQLTVAWGKASGDEKTEFLRQVLPNPKRSLSETGTAVSKLVGSVREVQSVVPRGVADMPRLAHHPGAEEVAVLTIIAGESEFFFKPATEALQTLASVKDWSRSFMVAHDDQLSWSQARVSFDWRRAPDVKFESFEDFYRRELQETFEKWADLQATCRKLIAGHADRAKTKKARKPKLYEFAPMLGPCEDHPVGSVEWAERISNRLQINVNSLSRHGVDHLQVVLRAVLQEKPWEV
jgi:hypothetical protein